MTPKEELFKLTAADQNKNQVKPGVKDTVILLVIGLMPLCLGNWDPSAWDPLERLDFRLLWIISNILVCWLYARIQNSKMRSAIRLFIIGWLPTLSFYMLAPGYFPSGTAFLPLFLGLILWHVLGCWLFSMTERKSLRAFIVFAFTVPFILGPILGSTAICAFKSWSSTL